VEISSFFLDVDTFSKKLGGSVGVAVVDTGNEGVRDGERKLANNIEVDVTRNVVDETLSDIQLC